ncbi:TAXI family TRAP transporter solute-binding subunit [Oscillibacter sp.]|uniref:TAXI family TRAP transporter solute-binding subunit n=1 Tax=Oscillibacter sp. TaxID=1945593 RepID=UPI00260FBBCB|nr:TAXI family TRAP transporter solute-binding subunit [Oscillibacter sp.]MDD3347239.1 TAXI family TRAP transporter solute-binding subunit [Oscillibacter sp.]
MKKFLSLLMAVSMMATVLAGCGGDKAAEKPADTGTPAQGETQAPASTGSNLTFTTGGSSGTYFAFGSVLAGQVSSSTGTKVTAVEGKGSQGNVELMDMEGAQLGFVQSDVMSYAYDGTNLFAETGKVDCFSTVAALYMEQVQIVTCDPSIKTVADLAGKNVSVGDSGSGVYYNAVDVLGAYGLDVEKDIKPTYQGFGDSAEALKDGKIDAAFVVAGAPTTAIVELSNSKPTYLVSLDKEHIDALRAESPYYSEYTIPADVYGLESDTTTVAVSAVIIARDDVSEQDVYNFVSGVFENIDAITAVHAKGGELSLDFATSVTSVPYHAGAAKYFAEKGYDVPTK